MWSIRKALVVIFLVVVSMPLLLFWAWPHARAMGSQFEYVNGKHLLLARNVASALKRYAVDLEATFDYLAEGMFEGKSIGTPDGLLHNLRIRHIRLVDMATGSILSSYGQLSADGSKMIAPARLAVLVRAAEGRLAGLTGVMKAADGSPALYLVRIRGGRMVLARIETSYFQEIAKSVSFGVQGQAAIVDQAGRVLAHPNPIWVKDAMDLSTVSAVARMIRGEAGAERFFSPALDIEVIAGFATVGSTGWGVMVSQPLSELTDEAVRIQRSSMAIFAMGLLAAALCALRFSLLIVTPLTSVNAAARRMAQGATGVQIEAPGVMVPSDLRELADTFNVMAASISEAKASEAAARVRAEQANRQKTDFVRYVTHELRSPVNAILGFVKMESARLRREGGGGGGHKNGSGGYTQHIEEAGTHLLSLINDLLDLGKIEAGHYTLSEEKIGLDEIVDRCFRMLAHVADERAITLNAVYDRGRPTILVDERAMYQVILNLMTNAVRYGRDGGVVELRSYGLADGGLEICVCDDGPGIGAEDLDRVMQPFGRIEHAGHDAPQGTGLGLPIVKKLVELHGGSFRLESAVGIGTVAYILLPAARCSVGPVRRPMSRSAA